MKLNLAPESDLTRPEMENIKLRLHRVETKEISTVTLGAIANSLLTTRGDIIVRNATVPERLALTVPSSPTINYLGVANGETQPSWKSASSAGAADAHVVATDANGYTKVKRLIFTDSDYITTDGDTYARWWNPGVAIGAVQYIGRYGHTFSYNVKLANGAWKSIGGGYGLAFSMCEGNFVFANTAAIGGANADVTWYDRVIISSAGNLVIATGGTLLVGANQVIGARGAAVADATDAASVIARLNDLLARLRTHGLIAT